LRVAFEAMMVYLQSHRTGRPYYRGFSNFTIGFVADRQHTNK